MTELLHLRHHSVPVEVLALDKECRLVYMTDELTGALALRMFENLVGCTVFIDHTLCKEQHTTAHLTGKAHLVGHHNHRHSLLGQPFHYPQHLAHHCGVESRSRLIEEQYLRFHRQGTGNGHTLLLSA